MTGSNFNYYEDLVVFNDIITEETILSNPPFGSSTSSGLNSITSPSHTSFVSFIHNPMALLKFSYKISVFLTSDEYTSLPTIGQNGTFEPNSYAIANAIAVFPVPGGPANNNALPAIFFYLINSTIIPAPSLAFSYPTNPPPNSFAVPSYLRPRPFI